MRRGSNREKINSLISKFREKVPGIAIRSTVIVGFPGETKENFDELCNWIKEIKFDNTPVSNGDLEVNKILIKKILQFFIFIY